MQNLVKSFEIITFLLLPLLIFANNIEVDNVVLTGQNTTDHYTMVQFDISWDNGWRDFINWDAAWVFVKYQGSDGLWRPARLGLNDPDHTAPAGAVINAANFFDAYAPGVFIYRDANGIGANNWSNIQLRWNYGENGVNDGDLVSVKVFAIEMVYVPQGAFDLGDGSGGVTILHFYDAGIGNLQPFRVNSQDAITVNSTGVGNLWPGITSGTSDSAFPTGYDAFYCMKYEITQEQYVEFLNTLTRTQQNTRTGTDISGRSVTNRYVMNDWLLMFARNGIQCNATLPASGPITLYCDYDGDGSGNEENDGQNIACNFLRWMDGCAYADWAGLRPMTELEYEKAGRGDQAAVGSEYAWGTASLFGASPLVGDYALLNAGYNNESISSQPTSIGNALGHYNRGSIDGPVRVGIFALSNSTREEAGASYYGIMELTGNLCERTVTIVNDDGREFTGNHGGGGLSANGNANGVASWPGYDGSEVTGASGAGRRGGSFDNETAHLRLSYGGRMFLYGDENGLNRYGFRCVRTAP